MPSETLLLLLRYAKSPERDATWRGVSVVLAPLYSSEMRLQDVLVVLLKAFEEALTEPRFELGAGLSSVEELVLAPVRGLHAVGPFGGATLATTYSVEQFYNAMVGHLLGRLAITRVDWCVNELRAVFMPAFVSATAAKAAARYNAHR